MPWFTWFKVIRVIGVDSLSYEHNTLEYHRQRHKSSQHFSTFLRCFVQLDQRLSSTMLKVMSSHLRFAQKPKRKLSKVPAVQTNSIYAILHGSLWIRPCSKKDYWECCVRCSSLDRGHNYTIGYIILTYIKHYTFWWQINHLLIWDSRVSENPITPARRRCKFAPAHMRVTPNQLARESKQDWGSEEITKRLGITKKSLLSWEWSLFQSCKMKNQSTHMTSILSMSTAFQKPDWLATQIRHSTKCFQLCRCFAWLAAARFWARTSLK